MTTYVIDLSGDDSSDIPITIDGVASTAGTWQNYDSGTDQVALPVLSRNYRMKDGPDALFLEDANHPLGPELVTNGGFDDGTTGWTSGSSATLSVLGGELSVENGATAYGYASASIETVIGRRYKLEAEAVSTDTTWQIKVGDDITTNVNNKVSETGVAAESISVTFIATATTTYLRLGNSTNTIGDTSVFDNVSVKCIETGAVLYNVDPEDWDRSKS